MEFFVFGPVFWIVVAIVAAFFAFWSIAFGSSITAKLIGKYLRKRRIAWVSLIAVTLCTAMVIIIISVMGGWLRMFKDSFHGLTGDVIVHGESLTGFPHYEEMIARIEKIPGVKAAVPTLETFGLVNISNVRRRGVQVLGYPIDRIGKVNAFPQSLYRQYQRHIDRANGDDPDWIPEDGPSTKPSKDLDANEKKELLQRAEQNAKSPSFEKPLSDEYYKAILPGAHGDVSKWPGIIMGAGVVGIGKDSTGKIYHGGGLYERWVKLTVLAISADSAAVDIAGDKGERNYWIVDDSRTKVWQYDNQSVYVPFDILQRDLKMDEQSFTDAATGQKQTTPARTKDIQVAVDKSFDLQSVKKQVLAVVEVVQAERQIPDEYPISVETWEESQATFIGAVEKEKLLVTFLFGMVSVVAIFLIFCIFYMIVVEKTRDIGIIKSVGATSQGVLGIFLGYGLAIGLVGAFLGLLGGYLIVHNINYLHTKMGELMGVQIWNPEIYAFDTIPNTMDPKEVTIIMSVAVLSSVLGALVPALRAARLHPVEALRWE